ncbi:MAG: mechanosensitive ion channel family protein [Candidatus Kapaibacterium sp.]
MNPSLLHNWKFEDFLIPGAVALGIVVVGLVLEHLLFGLYRKRAETKGWKLPRRVIYAFKGMIVLWFALAAFGSIIGNLPITAGLATLLHQIVLALYILSVTLVVGRIFVTITHHYSMQSRAVVPHITLVENLVRVVISVLGLLVLFRSLGVSITPVLTALGVGGLAVALALQDTLSNLFAGLYIILSQQLSTGDYVKVSGGEEGAIMDIAWRVTTLQTPAHTLVIVPNAKLAGSTIINYDRPEKVSSMVVMLEVKNDANLSDVEAIILQAAQERVKEDGDIDKTFAPILRYTALANTSVTVNLIIRTAEYRCQGTVRDLMLRRIYEKLRIKYPTDFPIVSVPAVVATAKILE